MVNGMMGRTDGGGWLADRGRFQDFRVSGFLARVNGVMGRP